MVETGATIIILVNDTILVELEDFLAGVHGDRQRLLFKFLDGGRDACSDLAPRGDFTHNFLFIVLTELGSVRVWVILIGHGTLLLLELPAVGHPATSAAVSFVSLAELLFVIFRFSGTVDQLRLR